MESPRKVLVVGVTGVIGSAVAGRLMAAGVEVVGVSRSASRQALSRHVVLDIADATEPAFWFDVLAGVDAVAYCAGALQEGPGDSLPAVHNTGPNALYIACERLGVRRVVHLSAVGVDRSAETSFSRSKLLGDEALMRRDLDWVILRPSVIMGPAARGSAALLRGLAALPVLPVPAGAGALQVVQLDDVVETMVFFLHDKAPARVAVDLVGPRRWTFDGLVGLLRQWLGWGAATTIIIPRWLQSAALGLGDLARGLGWQSVLSSTAGREMLRGATGDPARWTELTGIRPRDIEQVLRAQPATPQDRWYARLYLVRPWIFATTALFWIATGAIALGPGWTDGLGLMREGGVTGWPAAAIVVAGGLCDLAIGAAIGRRRTARFGVMAGLVVSVVYAIAGTVLVPRLWSDPLGPLLKVMPILVLHLVALGLVEDR
jgi:uncharacterized protein YbjT (DUF2867 family)